MRDCEIRFWGRDSKRDNKDMIIVNGLFRKLLIHHLENNHLLPIYSWEMSKFDFEIFYEYLKFNGRHKEKLEELELYRLYDVFRLDIYRAGFGGICEERMRTMHKPKKGNKTPSGSFPL